MKPDRPLISVILPTYNHGQFLRKAIESVLDQTYKNVELIIVDNYSKDNTEEIVKTFANDRVKYYKFRNNGVIAASRNHGIKHSCGEYVAFLDSDDVWHTQKIEKQLPHFEAPGIVGVASEAKLVAETPYYRKKKFGRSKFKYVTYEYKDILNGSQIFTSSVIVRKEMLERVGLFNEDKDLFAIEDWDLWLKMSKYGSFRILKQPLLDYLVSRKRGERAAEISKNSLKILDKQVELDHLSDKDITEPRVVIYLNIARNLLEFDRPQSRSYYRRALKETSNVRRKAKSLLGISLTLLPSRFRKICLLILYKFDRALSSLKN